MNLYEHTLIIKQDVLEKGLIKIKKKYEDIISKDSGKIIKFEDWGLMTFSHKIKKNKKGYYFHFKIEGDSNLINNLEKAERIDIQILRFLTVKVKKFNLEIQYFGEKKVLKNEAKI